MSSVGVAVEPSVGWAGSSDRLDLGAVLLAVGGLDGAGDDGVVIDQIAALEWLKSGCAAAQARLTHALSTSQAAAAAGGRVGRRSVAGQVALARGESRYRGSRLVGLAAGLVSDMPCTLAALRRGDVSEHRVELVAGEFACLSAADRRAADGLIGGELVGLGNRSVQMRAAAVAYRLDPAAVMGKVRGAVKDRHVSIRPAPDLMTRFSALLPVAQGVAVWAALLRAATVKTGVGDPRTRGQLMADELVAAVTGAPVVGCDDYGVPQYEPSNDTGTDTGTDAVPGGAADIGCTKSGHGDAAEAGFPGGDVGAAGVADAGQDAAASGGSGEPDAAGAGSPPETPAPGRPDGGRAGRAAAGSGSGRAGGGCTCGVPLPNVQLNIVMTDRALFGDDDEPAQLGGHGPVPAALARALVLGGVDPATSTWVRRLYADPKTGQLVAMDSRRRLFPAAARQFLINRDQLCRTPWCDAPIRHIDHVVPHARGGVTGIGNGQGLCEACNHTKQAPGWVQRLDPGGVITTITPTGHRYASVPPPPPTSGPWIDISAVEGLLALELLYNS